MTTKTYNIIGVGRSLLEAEIHAMRHVYYFVERYHRKDLPPIIYIKKRGYFDAYYCYHKYEITIVYEEV